MSIFEDSETKPDNKLTSIEAAALFLSDGTTTDPEKAVMIDKGVDLNMDALQRAHLRRMMGFDFRFKQQPNKLHVSSKQEPYVTTHCKINDGEVDKYGNITSEELIDRLVNACLRLKIKYEAEQKRLNK